MAKGFLGMDWSGDALKTAFQNFKKDPDAFTTNNRAFMTGMGLLSASRDGRQDPFQAAIGGMQQARQGQESAADRKRIKELRDAFCLFKPVEQLKELLRSLFGPRKVTVFLLEFDAVKAASDFLIGRQMSRLQLPGDAFTEGPEVLNPTCTPAEDPSFGDKLLKTRQGQPLTVEPENGRRNVVGLKETHHGTALPTLHRQS